MKTILLMIASAFLLMGCGATVHVRQDLGPAYTPTPTIDIQKRVDKDGFAGFSVRAHGMSVTQAKKLEEQIQGLRSQCVLGIAKENISNRGRPNSAIDSRYRSIYAVGRGIEEQYVLYDIDVTANCKRPEPPPKQRK
jgi:hypothetical protein